MSRYDDAPDDMDLHLPRRRRSRALDDADVAELLRGAAPAARPDLAGAAALVAALRTLPEAPEPRGALGALLRDGFDPAAVSPAADVPAVTRRSGARRAVVSIAGASLAAKALLGTGVAFAGVAAAAGGGVLGETAHDRFTKIVELVTPERDERPAQVPPLSPEDVAPTGPQEPELPPAVVPPVRASQRPGVQQPPTTRQQPVVPDRDDEDGRGRGRDEDAREDETDERGREDERGDSVDDRRGERSPDGDDEGRDSARPDRSGEPDSSGPSRSDRDSRDRDSRETDDGEAGAADQPRLGESPDGEQDAVADATEDDAAGRDDRASSSGSR